MSDPKHNIAAVVRPGLLVSVTPGHRGETRLTVTSGAVTALAPLTYDEVNETVAALLKIRDVTR